MLKLLGGLALLAAACAPVPSWPAGSKVVGAVCFEHETAGGWEPAQLRRPDGSLPVKGSPISGDWFFPMDAGQLRLRSCP